MNDDAKLTDEFFTDASSYLIASDKSVLDEDVTVKAGVWSALAGGGTYWILSDIANIDTTGIADETAALLAAGAGAFFGASMKLKGICEKTPENERLKKADLSKNATGGFFGGAAVAELFTAAGLSFADGGLMFAGTCIGLGYGYYRAKAAKTKYCPHCGAESVCCMRVCRNPECNRIFYPADADIDCSLQPGLGWHEIASVLQKQDLSYFDSRKLVEKELGDGSWRTYKDGDSFKVDCRMFFEWLGAKGTIEKIYSYKGHSKQLSRTDIHRLLEEDLL